MPCPSCQSCTSRRRRKSATSCWTWSFARSRRLLSAPTSEDFHAQVGGTSSSATSTESSRCRFRSASSKRTRRGSSGSATRLIRLGPITWTPSAAAVAASAGAPAGRSSMVNARALGRRGCRLFMPDTIARREDRMIAAMGAITTPISHRSRGFAPPPCSRLRRLLRGAGGGCADIVPRRRRLANDSGASSRRSPRRVLLLSCSVSCCCGRRHRAATAA